MTISQKLQLQKWKPLKIGLISILFSSFPVITLGANPQGQVGTSDAQIQTNQQEMPIAAQVTANAPPSMLNPNTSSITDNATGQSPAADKEYSNKNISMDQPNMSDDSILKYASDAASSAYSYDFKNYDKQMQMNQQYFTPQGWKAFMSALNKSNNLGVVQSRKLVASSTPNGKPTILKKGIKNGAYTWEIQVPLLTTYENETRLIKQNLVITMLISRASNPSGVGISHFVGVIVPGTQAPVTQTTTGSAHTPPVTITTPGTTTTTTNPSASGTMTTSPTAPSPGPMGPAGTGSVGTTPGAAGSVGTTPGTTGSVGTTTGTMGTNPASTSTGTGTSTGTSPTTIVTPGTANPVSNSLNTPTINSPGMSTTPGTPVAPVTPGTETGITTPGTNPFS